MSHRPNKGAKDVESLVKWIRRYCFRYMKGPWLIDDWLLMIR